MLGQRINMRGFTLIEAIIAMALIAILMSFGMPMYGTFMQNQRIRASAEGIVSGLQTARNEAIKQNARVEFLLSDEEPEPSNASSATTNVNGPHWMARALDSPSVGVHTYVAGRDGTEGTSGDTAGALIGVVGSTASVIFNSLGTVELAAATTTFDLSSANPSSQGQCIASSGPIRCLRVVLQPGGQARMCDPSITTSGDTRRC
jgi:type IV fimbrial biogenesis protein FimT